LFFAVVLPAFAVQALALKRRVFDKNVIHPLNPPHVLETVTVLHRVPPFCIKLPRKAESALDFSGFDAGVGLQKKVKKQ
jgi:hypothetical protein